MDRDLTNTEQPDSGDISSFDDILSNSDNFEELMANTKGKQYDCLRYAIVFDATSSMRSVWKKAINAVTEAVERIHSYKLSKPIEINIVAYRDVVDGTDIMQQSGYLTDISKLKAFISNVKCKGGGDFPENIEVGLDAIVGSEANMVILIGDAPTHGFNARKPWKDQTFDGLNEATRLGQEKCPIYGLYLGDDEEEIFYVKGCFEAFAELSGGKAYNFNNLSAFKDIIITLLTHDKDLIKHSMQYIPYMPETDLGRSIKDSL